MKDYKIILGLLFLFFNSSFAGRVNLTISNIRSIQGQIIISVCSDEYCHVNIEKIQQKEINYPVINKNEKVTTSPTMTISFDLPNGFYSFFALHDENNSGDQEFNVISYPLEDFAISNLNHFPLGLPSFKDSRVNVNFDQKNEFNFKLMLIEP